MVEELKRCQIILDEFFDDINTEPFHEPVTWRELGLFDYPKLIKTPMDMGTVRSKMGKYKTHEGFIADMRLIWSNCMIYNADGSDFHALAENLMEKLNEALKDANLVSKDMENSYSEPTLEEKAEFSENIYKLPSDVLGQIVNILDEKCPGALDKRAADELDINVDVIDGNTFMELNQLVRESLPNGRGEGVLYKSSKKGKKKPEGPKSKKQKV